MLFLLLFFHLALSIPGGWGPCTQRNAEEVTEASKCAMTEAFPDFTFKAVESCEEQVVAGMNYRLRFRLTDSNGNDVQKTAVIFMDLHDHCHVVLSRRSTSIPGGWSSCNQQMDDLEIQSAIAEGFKELQRRSNSAFRLILDDVTSCKEQIVEGTNYEFTYQIGGSPDGTTFEKTVRVFVPLDKNEDKKVTIVK